MTNVCPRCFKELGLKKRIIEIRPDFPNQKCSFHPQYKGIPISAVAEIVDIVFRNQYGWGEYVSNLDEQSGDSLEYLVEDLTGADDYDIAKALADQLIEDDDYWPQDGGEAFYADDQNYVPYQHSYWRHSTLWENFCRSIIHSQRFFNSNAKELIREIFDGIQHQRDHRRRAPIYEIKPGDKEASFFRARAVENDASLEEIIRDPRSHLGPPPERYRRAGRMNPSGIGCLYAAYDLPTCIAELRPTVGSTIVGVRFELTRPIHVLDTTLFEAPMKPLSVFSKNYMIRMEQWSFMRHFCREIAKPISRNDEHLDYIPTQAVAEYFLHHHIFKRSGKTERIEAIIFQSAQAPQDRNIVLLGDAAQVHREPKEKETRQGKPAIAEFFPNSFESFLENLPRTRNAALSVVDGSIEVRRVTGAHYDSKQQSTFLDAEGDF